MGCMGMGGGCMGGWLMGGGGCCICMGGDGCIGMGGACMGGCIGCIIAMPAPDMGGGAGGSGGVWCGGTLMAGRARRRASRGACHGAPCSCSAALRLVVLTMSSTDGVAGKNLRLFREPSFMEPGPPPGYDRPLGPRGQI